MKTRIVLVTTDKETNAAIKATNPDMIEVRVDLMKKRDASYIVAQLTNRRKLGIPLVLTVRNQVKEGAAKAFPDADKRAVIAQALPLAHWIDIELSSPLLKETVKLARKLKKKVIISMHDLKAMPAKLDAVVAKGLAAGGDCVKIAVRAKTPSDVIGLVNTLGRFPKKPLALMAVGPWGPLSRLMLPLCGSQLVYAVLEKPIIEGQIDIKSLKAQLKQIT